MKKIAILIFAAALFITACSEKNSSEKYKVSYLKDKNGYEYKTVSDDPMSARIYTLKNGLKVYLTVNKNEPKIMTYIPVKAGGVFDPVETTGLAHYLEHMMFKGTSKIGTVNWTEEKKLLDQLSDLFEQHRNTDNEEEKKAIYHQIDSVSLVAATYAIANEYDKTIASIGGTETNAYTDNERTVYENNIPSNEVGRWLEIEKERFSDLVLRLFHTELEAVYEEFNMSQDRDRTRSWNALMGALFPTHPYGTQTVLGKGEHLKNPSMVNIHNYFDRYYVPNNMAVCMSGDFDPEAVIVQIDSTLGKLERRDVEPKVFPKENDITEPIVREVFGPDAENVQIAYRFDGIHSDDARYVKLISSILENGKAGLFDLDLNKGQKVLRSGTYENFMIDYSFLDLYASPIEGQTLEEVRDLLLQEVEKLKRGEFEEWLIEASINKYKKQSKYNLEDNSRAHDFVEAFATNTSWEDYISFDDKLSSITKEDIVRFANDKLKNNYAIVYKRTGQDTTIMKVEKPKITNISVNRDTSSEFYKALTKRMVEPIQPVFVDFKKEILQQNLSEGIEFNYVRNNENDLFSLFFIVDNGTFNDKYLRLVMGYVPLIGTNEMTVEEVGELLYRYGLDFSVVAGEERSYVSISGLSENFDKAIAFINEMRNNIKADTSVYNKYVKSIMKGRADEKKNRRSIFDRGVMNYAYYGPNSPFTNVLTESEMLAVNPDSLINLFKNFFDFKQKVFYYGPFPSDTVIAHLGDYYNPETIKKDVPAPMEFPEREITSDEVYFFDYDMVQANVIIFSKDCLYDSEIVPESQLFNEYFGAGMGSIVFQEIRESRALAYSAYSYYNEADKIGRSNKMYSYIATQADKLYTALDALLDLQNNIPNSDQSFEQAKDNLVLKIQSDRINPRSLYWQYLSGIRKGVDYDLRKVVYESIPAMTWEDLDRFANNHVKGKNHCILVLADKDLIDFNSLSKYGKVKELTYDDVFRNW